MYSSPTGISDDGSAFFQESDITKLNGDKATMSLKLLPTGDCCLHAMPDPSPQYYGTPTPIKCVANEYTGAREYHCQHITNEDEVKNGAKEKRCDIVFPNGLSTNMGTIRSHARSEHWNNRGEIIPKLKGQTTLFTSMQGMTSKKRKVGHTMSASTSVASSTLLPAPDHRIDIDVEENDGGGKMSAADSNIEGGSSANIEVSLRSDTEGIAKDDIVEVDTAIELSNNEVNSLKSEIECLFCGGIFIGDLPNIKLRDGYDFSRECPMSIHSSEARTKCARSNLIPKVTWKCDSEGNIKSLGCKSLVVQDKSVASDVNGTTTIKGKHACGECVKLQFNQNLLAAAKASTEKKCDKHLPNLLCPVQIVEERINELNKKCNSLRLDGFNLERKLCRLSAADDDDSRLLRVIQDNDVPALRRLLVVHTRNGGAVKSFINKISRAASMKSVGHGTVQRGLIQRGSVKSGTCDPLAYETLLKTILVNKLGCGRLNFTFSFTEGGMSNRTMTRHVNQLGAAPNVKIMLTSCIDDDGMKGVEQNMEDVLSVCEPHLPKEKCPCILMIDGVAVDEKVGLDESRSPHQVTGTCRHLPDATFNDWDDAVRIQNGLNDDEFHLAKEAEVIVIAFNHKSFTAVIPICVSPTCKCDNFINKSTDTVEALIGDICKKWKAMGLNDRCPMSMIVSDGAGQFRKAAGKVLAVDLPVAARQMFKPPEGGGETCLLSIVLVGTMVLPPPLTLIIL